MKKILGCLLLVLTLSGCNATKESKYLCTYTDDASGFSNPAYYEDIYYVKDDKLIKAETYGKISFEEVGIKNDEEVDEWIDYLRNVYQTALSNENTEINIKAEDNFIIITTNQTIVGDNVESVETILAKAEANGFNCNIKEN